MTVAKRARHKVAHLTLSHRPFDVRIFTKECRTLAEAGYDVHLAVPDAPPGRHQSVTLHGIPRPHGGNGWSRWQERISTALEAARGIRADLYHVHDPELLPVALALRRNGARVIYDAHEDAPIEAWSMNRGRPFRRLGLPVLWWTLLEAAKGRLDAFVAATPRIASRFPQDRTIEVRNYPRIEMFEGFSPTAIGSRRDLVFAGLVSERRGAIEMLDVLSHLDPGSSVRLKLFGTIASDALATRMRKHASWARVEYVGYRPWSEVLASYRTALAGLLLYEKTPEQLWCMPVKLFEFLLSGLPTIASDIPFWRNLLEGNPNTRFVDATDTQSIAQAVEWLVANPEESAQRARDGQTHARAHFAWQGEGERLVALYDQLLE